MTVIIAVLTDTDPPGSLSVSSLANSPWVPLCSTARDGSKEEDSENKLATVMCADKISLIGLLAVVL